MGLASRAAAPVLLAVLLAAAPPWGHAQETDDVDGLGELTDELRQLREEAKESNRMDWALFIVSLVVGTVIAAVAVAGTVRNAWQLRRHVDLVKEDMDKRLRPQLGWTTDSNLLLRSIEIGAGGLFRIRIINAGQVVARRIVCEMRFGMACDFESGKAESKREHRGSLAPDKLIEVRVPITTEQMKNANRQNLFHAEVLIEYCGSGEETYRYSLVGDYDGVDACWRD